MNKLLLTCIVVAGAGSLHGMEVQQKQVSLITLLQTYQYFLREDVLLPEIAQQIFVKLFEAHGINLENFPHEIEQSCKDSESLVEHIETLIDVCGYQLASKLCELCFPHAKVSICDIKPNNYASLHYAIISNYPEVIQILIKIAGDNTSTLLTMQNTDGRTALHYVALYDETENMKLLLDAAGDNAWTLLTMQDTNDWTASHVAASDNNTENIKLLLGAAGDKVWTLLTMQTSSGWTALHLATCNNDTESIKLLLDAAGDNAYTLLTMQDTDGRTALHRAAFYNKTENIKLLLDAAGDNAPTLLAMKRGDGETAFDLANSETKEVMRKYMIINK